MNEGVSRNVRRHSRKGPSPLRHAIMAIIIVICMIASVYMLYGILTKNTPQNPVAKVEIIAPDPSETIIVDEDPIIDVVQASLPDLVGGTADNPTQVLAGAEAEVVQKDNAPKTLIPSKPKPQPIRINGQPAGRRAASALIKAPIQGLSRQAPYGLIPSISQNGNTAFTSYAKPYQTPVNARRAAIIVGGLGLNAEVTSRAILTLPEQVTLSFAAHSPQLQNWIDQARENGHEVLLEIPMEARDAAPSQSARTLTVTDDIASNTRNLDWLLSRASGYFAVTNYNGDKFLSRSDIVAPVMSYLKDAGLGLIFDSSFQSVALPALATTAKLPFIEADMILDEINNQTLTEAKLQELGTRALAGDEPIGIGFAYPSSLTAISAWALEAAEKGIVLVSASSLMTP